MEDTDNKFWAYDVEFLKAIEEKNYQSVNAILDAGYDVDKNLILSKNALNICVSHGWYEMAQLLIRRGCSLSLRDDYNQTPLMLAVQRNDYHIAKLLLENRADCTCQDFTSNIAVHYACQRNNREIVQLLVEANSRVINWQGCNLKTPLSVACEYGSIELISYLLMEGADVNAIDSYGNSPLLHTLSSERCTPETVMLLINAGANINHVNGSSESPLLRIFRKGSVKKREKFVEQFREICLLLIERGANVNFSNQLGQTPLHYAVTLDDEMLTRKLLNVGAYVNPQNKLDYVPLSCALQNGASDSVIQLLMEADTDPRFITFDSYQRRSLPEPLRAKAYKYLKLLIQRSKEVPTLMHLSRRIIRKRLFPDLEKRCNQLQLPPSLVNFIQLIN